MPARIHREDFNTLSTAMLLVLLLSTAPMPVGHCHSDHCSGWSSDQMALHLQTCHGGDANSGNWPSGWHWHWRFQVGSGIALHDGIATTQCDLILKESAQAPSNLDCESQWDAWVWKASVSTPPIPIDRRRSFTTTALLSSRQSLPALFGILRC